MSTANITVEITNFICFKCGCPYSAPTVQWNNRRNGGKPIYCPNGHENFFIEEKSFKEWEDQKQALADIREELQRSRAELTDTKGMLVTLRHRAEQAEAKVDAAPPDGWHRCNKCSVQFYGPKCSCGLDGEKVANVPQPQADETADGKSTVKIFLNEYKKPLCPICKESFKSVGFIRRHLLVKHDAADPYKAILNKQYEIVNLSKTMVE